MNFAHFVRKWGQTTPDNPAVAVGGQVVLSYAELADRVSRIAGSLQTQGLRRGDRVGLLMKNVPEYFECLMACWHAGLAAVPINAKLHTRESAFILQDSQTTLCITTPGLSAQLKHLAPCSVKSWIRSVRIAALFKGFVPGRPAERRL